MSGKRTGLIIVLIVLITVGVSLGIYFGIRAAKKRSTVGPSNPTNPNTPPLPGDEQEVPGGGDEVPGDKVPGDKVPGDKVPDDKPPPGAAGPGETGGVIPDGKYRITTIRATCDERVLTAPLDCRQGDRILTVNSSNNQIWTFYLIAGTSNRYYIYSSTPNTCPGFIGLGCPNCSNVIVDISGVMNSTFSWEIAPVSENTYTIRNAGPGLTVGTYLAVNECGTGFLKANEALIDDSSLWRNWIITPI